MAMSFVTTPLATPKEAMKDAFKQDPTRSKFSKTVSFLAVPTEVHLKIFSFLNPIDSVCLSLVNKYTYKISPPMVIASDSHNEPNVITLETGSPFIHPIVKIEGCRHCVPVLYYPHHCELHYHIRSFIPKDYRFCGGPCRKYTMCDRKGLYDDEEYCGSCGVEYSRRYKRGRRHLDLRRPGEKQERLCMWYNR